jgi:tRNA nucleotidyltransferase (CCA-adding enzyme)
MTDTLPAELLQVLTETPEFERVYLVGGCVRDWLLNLPNKDYDVEIFGLDYERMAEALTRWGKVDRVGKSFGVVKLTLPSRHTYDFSIPRRDSKVAPGHKGFRIVFDPTLEPREAAARRDYTINSLMFDPRRGELLDFFRGREDLRRGILRHTSPAFPEDPLRVLRGMQFAARFDLDAAPETIELARSIKASYPELAKERVREEWFKWAEKSTTPSRGLKFLQQSEWVEHFPELAAVRGVPQDPEWHPEGDVWNHTLHCCDALAKLVPWKNADSQSRIVYMLAVLTHDFGKAQTTTRALKRGKMRIISPGHEELSGTLAESFLAQINTPCAVQQRVIPLVVNHMAHFSKVTDRGVRRLAKRLEPENIEGLLTVMTADAYGRPPRPLAVPAQVNNIAKKAQELAVRTQAPQPILLGRHLLECGFTPGRELGDVLKRAYEAQLAGAFHDVPGALQWLAGRSKIPLPAFAREAILTRGVARAEIS